MALSSDQTPSTSNHRKTSLSVNSLGCFEIPDSGAKFCVCLQTDSL